LKKPIQKKLFARKIKKKKHSARNDVKNVLVYTLSWVLLSPKQKNIRIISLQALSDKRNSNQSLSKICKNHGISVKTVIRNTNAFKKVNGKWVAKKFDRISRVLKINENGQEKSIETSNSKTASIIGKYHNAVKQFLNTGDSKALQKFKNLKIKDSDGNIHSLATNTLQLTEINERIEEPEFYEVYSS
jgi:hypothetical protein